MDSFMGAVGNRRQGGSHITGWKDEGQTRHCLNEHRIDAPRHADHEAGVAAVRAYVESVGGFRSVRRIYQGKNLGLARSVVEGVTQVVAEYGQVIVLEDDLVLSPSFLDYMLQALDRYAGEKNVYQISGYMFPVTQPADADAFFLPLITTWGWATWRHAWQVFNWHASDALEQLKDPSVRRRFDLQNSYPYSVMLENQLRNQTESWGILFWWQVFKARGLALHPRQSLVWNGGLVPTTKNFGWSTS
jgi:hypothetical protein